jgi:FMN phosphatase YigB (HAD superfamily)/SAM-dependent methyltransferase
MDLRIVLGHASQLHFHRAWHERHPIGKGSRSLVSPLSSAADESLKLVWGVLVVTSLKELFVRHEGKVSDKWSSYLDYYDRILTPLRDRQITLLEVGVQNGGSLEVWAKYFPSAQSIIGCDIDPKCAELRFSDDRIRVVVGDIALPETVASIGEHVFDVIIDDGSHTAKDIYLAFAQLFRKLKPGGVYIVEDLHSSYWSGRWSGGLSKPTAAMEFFRRLTDVMNFKYWGLNSARRASALEDFAEEFGVEINENSLARIGEMVFRDSICVITKSETPGEQLGERLISGSEATVDEDTPRARGRAFDFPQQEGNPFSRFVTRGQVERELKLRKEQLAQESWRLQAATADLKRTQEELAEARRDAAWHKFLLDEAHRSHSWRITGPLRAVAPVLRPVLNWARTGRNVILKTLRAVVWRTYRAAPRNVQLRMRMLAAGPLRRLARLLGANVPFSGGRYPFHVLPEERVRRVPLRASTRARGGSNAGRVVVAIHAFYIDLLPNLFDRLAKSATTFDLAIFVTSEEHAAAAKDVLKRYPFPNTFVIVGKNRGRNFGPMLVEWGRRFLDYDFVLHVHTKKSLRTGFEQEVWREHLFDSLIGNGEVFDSLVAVLAAEPRVGIVAPEPFPNAAYWCGAWLSVGHLIRPFFARLGVPTYPVRGYLDFSWGAMFLARTAALAPLLRQDWNYDDFDAEPASDDGTLAHVMERSLGVIGQASGFEFASVDLADDSVAIGRTRILWPSYFGTVQLLEQSFHEKTVTFDLFDTIVTRRSSCPEDVQKFVGFVLSRELDLGDGQRFYEYRREAEALARANGDEVGLEEIYACFKLVCGWSPAAVKVAMETECKLDLASIVARDRIVETVRRLAADGHDLAVVSDTYFSRDFVGQVLNKVGLAAVGIRPMLSSEMHVRKDRGDMWSAIAATEYSKSLVHIGDSEQADIQQPIRHGLRSIGVMNTALLAFERGATMPAGWREGDSDWTAGLLIGPVIAKLGNSPFHGQFDDGNPLLSTEDFGYLVAGPLLFAFTAWTLQQARDHGISDLFFLSREGYYLKQICDRVVAGREGGGPATSYLATSRQASLSVAMAENFEIDMLLKGSGFTGTARQFLESRLGFSVETGGEFRVTQDDLTGNLRQFISDRRDVISAHCESARRNFLIYAGQIGLVTADRPSVVDIGYAGTIQRSLQEVLGRGMGGLYMMTSAAASDIGQVNGASARGYFMNEGVPRSSQTMSPHFSLVLEALLMAPHGRVSGYGTDASGRAYAKYAANTMSGDATNRQQTISAATKYCEDMMESFGHHILDVDFSPEVAESMFTRALSGRWRFSLGLQSIFFVDDHFCGYPTLDVLSLYDLDSVRRH